MHQISTVEISQKNPDIVYLAVGGRDNGIGISPTVRPTLMKSTSGFTDGNLNESNPTFVDLTSNLPTLNSGYTPVITGIAIDPNDDEHVYISFTGYYEGYKVWETTDGGSNWSSADPAITLYNLPVNDIVIQDGTSATPGDSRIFIATDAGVYCKDVGETCWLRFGDIPNVRVLELMLKTCTNQIYASTYGRGVWKTDLPELTMPLSEIVIDEDMTFDEDKFFYNSLRVTNNSTLTITADVYMPAASAIVVEPGSELILDGGRLTSACGDMWQGIEVHGNTNMIQTDANQGVLTTKNGAVIENARDAIRLWDATNSDWTSLGGIVRCTNTDFINNRRSCEFMAYNQISGNEAAYKGYFNKCNFIFNNDNLLSPEETAPAHAVSLWGVRGVIFRGCNFLNTADVSQSIHRSEAILSIDAAYHVGPYCTAPIPVGGSCPTGNILETTITGYNTGIKAMGAITNLGPKVTNTVFDKNMVGLFLDEGTYSEITDNDFFVGSHPYPPLFPEDDLAIYNTGLLTSGATDFIIEDNTFTGFDNNTNFTHGVVVQEGDGAPLSVYKNELTDLGSGTIGAGSNDGQATLKKNGEFIGLRFICNQNSGNSTDMEVRGLGPELFGYIDSYQSGYDSGFQPAANALSAADGDNANFVHMDFESDKFYYYLYDNNTTDQIPGTLEVSIEPPYPDGAIVTIVGTDINGCPDHTLTGGGPVKGEYYSLKSAFYNLLYTYHQFIDQGNTESALNDVAQSWSTNAWNLRDELMAVSPNNSDTVLMSAADKNLMPHGMLLEVLLANQAALLNGDVIDHVECCIPDPLPDYMIDILQASRNSIQTTRKLTELNLSNLRQDMVFNHRIVVNEMLRDTLGTPRDSMETWLDDVRHKEGRYAMITHYLSQGDYTDARETMDSLQSQLDLKGAAVVELNKMRQLTTFLENITGQGKNIAQLDTTEINFLATIADDPTAGTAGARAENILCFFYGMCTPPPSTPKSNVVSPRKPKPNIQALIEAQNKVKISPNPADQYVQLEYELLFSKRNTAMTVYDQLGKEVSSYTIGTAQHGVEILDTRKLVSGLYIVEIVQEGQHVSSEKFIVQH
jgi:hypothetical protein